MTHTEAEQLLGILVGGTGGWNSASDETFVIYTRQLETLGDLDAAMEAVQQIITTWEEARRPPVAAVFNAYRAALRRQMMTQPALPSTGRLPTLAEGRKIAARAYAQECERSGRQPNKRTLDSLLGIIGTEQQ